MSVSTEGYGEPPRFPARAWWRAHQDVVVLFGALLVFHALIFRTGHDWGGDFAQYIAHARNIVEGRPYDDLTYLPNPHYVIGPAAYPPVFPLVLAPIYAVAGLNLEIMKLVGLLALAVGLLAIYASVRSDDEPWVALTVMGIVGVMPHFWDLETSVLSDLPFLAWCFLALVVIHRQGERPEPRGRGALRPGLAIGALLYAAMGTRTVGVVLLAAFVVAELLRRKRLPQCAVVAAITSLALFGLQAVVVGADSGYAGLFEVSVKTVMAQARYYGRVLAEFWVPGVPRPVSAAASIIAGTAALGGYVIRIRRRVTVFEIFTMLYLLVPLVWPFRAGLRFLVPVVPLVIWYAVHGIATWLRLLSLTWTRVLGVVAVAAVGVVLLLGYRARTFGPISDGVTKPEAVQLFEWVRASTPPDAVIFFEKPRVLALFTDRAATVHEISRDDRVWERYRSVGADYVIVGPPTLNRVRHNLVVSFLGRYADRFVPVYRNADFAAYRVVRPGPGAP